MHGHSVECETEQNGDERKRKENLSDNPAHTQKLGLNCRWVTLPGQRAVPGVDVSDFRLKHKLTTCSEDEGTRRAPHPQCSRVIDANEWLGAHGGGEVTGFTADVCPNKQTKCTE